MSVMSRITPVFEVIFSYSKMADFSGACGAHRHVNDTMYILSTYIILELILSLKPTMGPCSGQLQKRRSHHTLRHASHRLLKRRRDGENVSHPLGPEDLVVLVQYLWASCTYFHEHGTMLPPDWKKVLQACDAIYFGAAMMSHVGNETENSLWSDQLVTQILWGSLLLFRREFDQYNNLRPCRLLVLPLP